MDKRDERTAELAAQAWEYVWQEHEAWLQKHSPAKPGEPRRFYVEDIMDNTDANPVERVKLWPYVRDTMNAREGWFLVLDIHRGYDPLARGAYKVSGDEAERVTLETHTFSVSKGIVRTMRRQAIRLASRMGQRAWMGAVQARGMDVRMLLAATHGYGMPLPEEMEKLLLEKSLLAEN